MEYKLNLGEWEFIFPVPCSVVDKYLKDAGFVEVKALLWILRNKEVNISKACSDLAVTKEEFSSAFEFWKRLGLFSIKGSSENAESKKDDKEVKKNMPMRYQRPNSSHIASRIRQSSEIAFLMREAAVILARPISSGDSAVLLMLHDNEGLPSDVILMLLQYAVSIGKCSMRYIQTMGNNWALCGIDSIEKAEKKINDLNSSSIIWKRFEDLIGIERRTPTSSEEEIVLRWYKEWNLGDELIKYAYDICVDTKGKYSIRYMDGILKRWHAKGIVTKQQAKGSRNYFKNRKANEGASSYSVEEYEDYIMSKYK